MAWNRAALPLLGTSAFLILSVVTALVVFFSSGAPFLSIIIIGAAFCFMAFILLLAMPVPGENTARICRGLLILYLVLTVLWPRYALFHLPGMPGLTPSRTAYLLLVLTWVYLIIRSPTYLTRLMTIIGQNTFFFVCLSGLVTLTTASIFVSAFPFASANGVANEIFFTYLPMLIALSVISSRSQVYQVILAISLAVLVSSLLGLLESAIQRNLFIGFIDIDSDYLQQTLRDKIRDGSYRIQSTFSHPLTFSECIVLSIPLFSALLYRSSATLRYIAFLFVMSISIYVLYRTGSRSGFGAAFAAILLSLLFNIVNKSRENRQSLSSILYVLVAILLGAMSLLALSELSDLLIGRTASELSSSRVRVGMWTSGLRLAFDQPILGYGQNMAAYVLGYTGYGGGLTIDSYYLSVLLQSGFISLGFYVLMMTFPIVKTLRFSFRVREDARIASFLSASISAFLLVKAILSLPHNHGIAMVLIALLLITMTDPLGQLQRSPTPKHRHSE